MEGSRQRAHPCPPCVAWFSLEYNVKSEARYMIRFYLVLIVLTSVTVITPTPSRPDLSSQNELAAITRGTQLKQDRGDC